MLDPEEIFRDLPTDPYLAAYEALQRMNAQLFRGKEPSDSDYRTACGFFEALYEQNGWKPIDRTAPNYNYSDSVEDIAKKPRSNHRLQYEAYANQIMSGYQSLAKNKAKSVLGGAAAKTFGYAILEPDEKTEIHKHIETIRKLIQGSGLDDRKKNALFNRLTELSKEVDRNGTRTDGFFAFASEFAFCMGQFSKAAKPAIDDVKDVLRIVTRARARTDGIKLPAGNEVLSLPKPDEDAASEAT
jgi:hypothetical protein